VSGGLLLDITFEVVIINSCFVCLDVKEAAVAQIRDQPEVEGRRSGGLAT
jgi:hypothetical protein